MCGICGVLHLGGEQTAESLPRAMVAAQRHRGPDDEGYLCVPGASLGFCRLAILDLTPMGRQPMANEDGTVWLIFNGEIYNFRELVPLLERRGHMFRSHSDSEVILHAYEEWGTDCVRRLNGMFAFAICDRRRRRVFLARDRLGVKPLYYWSDGTRFAFGSELRSLLALPFVPHRLSQHALRSYLACEYVPAPESIFAGIRKLSAGHSLTIRLDGAHRGLRTDDWQPERYWELAFMEEGGPRRSVDEYAEELRELLTAAVARRLISDVPLGAFLSGGIDSSSVVALMAGLSADPVRTFSIGFEEQSFDESDYAQLVARHFATEHHMEALRPDVRELVRTVAASLDEPLADASALPTYLVSRSARRHVTVALSGDGGDELFAGYDWYRAARFAALAADWLPAEARHGLAGLAARIAPSPHKKDLRDISRRLLEGLGQPAALQHARWQVFWRADELARLLAEPAAPPEGAAGAGGGFEREMVALLAASGSPRALDQQQYADIKRYLPDDILFKVDRMSMAVSLETRGPFLDYTLAEFAARLPPALRLRGFSTKYLLRRAMRDLLPEAVLHRPKLGFNIPYRNWLRGELKGLLLEALASDRLRAQGIFQPAVVQTLIHEHLEGVRDHAHKLWQLLMFQLWAQTALHPLPAQPQPAAAAQPSPISLT